MAAAPQFERDLRSASKEWKRSKDSAVKWSQGARHLAGVQFDRYGDIAANVPEHQLAKSRPEKRFSEQYHNVPKTNPNLVKLRRNHTLPNSRFRSKLHAKGELRDGPSALDSPSTPTAPATLSSSTTLPAAAADPFLYSFDRADSPGGPLTLEVFVKQVPAAAQGRATERLVAREYEVLDGNGEAVRGRRARAVLRGEEDGGGEGDVEGFELL